MTFPLKSKLTTYFNLISRFVQSAIEQHENINSYLLLGRVYVRLDQPITALDVYTSGLDKFPQEVTLTTAIARWVFMIFSPLINIFSIFPFVPTFISFRFRIFNFLLFWYLIRLLV